MKLQDAFAAERNAAGGWTLIGYTAPTSNNFTYSGIGIDADKTDITQPRKYMVLVAIGLIVALVVFFGAGGK